MSNKEEHIHNLTILPHTIQPISSDHYAITFNIDLYMQPIPKITPKKVYDFTKADWTGLCDFMLDLNWSECFSITDVETLWSNIKGHITGALPLFIPRVRLRSRQHAPWLKSNLLHQLNCLRSKKKKIKSTRITATGNEISKLEQEFQNNFDVAKSDYEAKLTQDFASTNNSKIFRYLNMGCHV